MSTVNKPFSANTHNNRQFFRTLQELHAAVAAPIVPGELRRWCAAVAVQINAATRLFDHCVRCDHAEQFETIENQDPGLMARVQTMRTRDREFQQRVRLVQISLQLLRTQIAAAGVDEASVIVDAELIASRAQLLIVDIQQQQTALRTLVREASDRNREIGD